MKTIKKRVECYIEYPACEICGEALEPIGMREIEVMSDSWLGRFFGATETQLVDECKCCNCGHEQDTLIWDYPIEYRIVKD